MSAITTENTHKERVQDLFQRLHDQASSNQGAGPLLIKPEDTEIANELLNHTTGLIWGYRVQIDLGDGKRGIYP